MNTEKLSTYTWHDHKMEILGYKRNYVLHSLTTWLVWAYLKKNVDD